MKILFKRLTALNLALILLLAMLPAAVAAPEGDASEEDAAELLATYSSVGIIGANGDRIYYNPSYLYVGETACSCDGGGSGTGWAYSGGILYLDEDYSGDPIQATDDLLLDVSGEVAIRNESGPALTSVNGSIHIFKMDDTDDRLTVISGSGNAVSAKQAVRVESPANVEFMAPEGSPASRGGIYYDDAKYAEHALLTNRTFTGADPDSTEEVDTINHYEAAASGTTLVPYQSYIRMEGLPREEAEICLTLDPGEGSLPGLSAGKTDDVLIGMDEADLSEYQVAVVTLPQLPDPDRSGYVFTGWKKEENASDCYRSGDSMSVTQRTTPLYAVWAEAPGDSYIIFDGNGKKLDSPEMEKLTSDALPLTDGSITLPENHANGFVGWYPEKLELPDLSKTDFYEGLYFPGQTVSLPSGTVLYAVYYHRDTAVIHGNGYLTAEGNDRILTMAGKLQDTPGSLEVYSKAMDAQAKGFFRADGKALLDYNTESDGSGRYSGVADSDVYAQWTDAPAGSVLLYSYTPATTEEGRCGKVLTPAEAASFDPGSDYGFSRFAHDFDGWYSGNDKVEGALPAADENGYVILHGKWNLWSVTYSGTGRSGRVDYDGRAYIADGERVSGKTFNGWNSQPDGSGQWFLPGKYYQMSGSTTLYPQYLDTPADGNWVLVEASDGEGCYQKLETQPIAGSDKVSVTLPESETGWVFSVPWSGFREWSETFGYYGGKTYTVNPRTIFKEGDAPFHGNGGTFRNGTEFRSYVIAGSSWSSLALYPAEKDFETMPDGKVLRGWSTEKEYSPSATMYRPGASDAPSSGRYYAIWDSADAVYVNFKDQFNSVDNSFSVRGKAGETITLPNAKNRPGYQLDGWSDGSKLLLPGQSYVIPANDVTLTAKWSEHIVLIVDGKEYDPAVNHDYSAAKGWKYEASTGWKKLYLSGYHGGELYLPGNTDIYLSGENTVTAAAGKAAIGARNYVYVYENYQSDEEIKSLSVTGGDGAPAFDVQNLNLQSGISIDAVGGSGAPAVQTYYGLSIQNGHTRLVGGSGAPAVRFTYSYSSFDVNSRYAALLAGDSPETAVEIAPDDYKGESCIITQPKLYTLTIDAGEGKVNGRAELVLQAEYGQEAVRMDKLDVWHPDGKLAGWYDAEGQAHNYSIWLYEDLELTARWNTSPYDRYIYLNCRNAGSVNGKEGGDYIELPENGTVRLPMLTFNENQSEYVFEYWYLDGETDRRYFPANVDIPVEWLQHGFELRPSYYYTGNGNRNNNVLIHPNGTSFTEGIGFYRLWLDNGVFNARYMDDNADGWVIDSLNTKPDGSGTRYGHGAVIPLGTGGMPVLYAQWKPNQPTYVTKKNNENAPQNNDTYRYFAYTTGNKNGERLSSLLGWRTEDGTRIYLRGEKTDLPSGTTLYAYYGDTWTDGAVRLYGNGADGPAPLLFAGYWRTDEDGTRIYVYPGNTVFVREGYVLSGWNTSADGSGTAYPTDIRFHIGYSDENGDNWKLDSSLYAKTPKTLYAQWEKLPVAEVPVPADMAAQENAVIYLATYDENGGFLGTQWVAPDATRVTVYEEFDTYRFFCFANDGSAKPLTSHEEG